ncbi:MAG: hypothetical protein RL148_656 [Planctomycetota bacterium]
MRRASTLFAVGLLVRLAHWVGSPDRGWPWAVSYQGDAPKWQQLAQGAAANDPESLLPFRPPAMDWFTSVLWDGDPATSWLPRLALAVLGALVAPLTYRALQRSFEERIAWCAGWICVLSTNLVLLGSGVHSEIPYLVLFLCSLGPWDRLRTNPAWATGILWGLLQAACCLFRADHLLTAGLLTGWILWARGPRAAQAAMAMGLGLAAGLAPWQFHASRAVHAFQHENAPPLPLPGARLPWDDDALAEVRAMPAFAQAPTFGFVTDTAWARNRTRVTAADLAVLEEAYGSRPGPLATPTVALYGPLNFFLGNSPEAAGGFSRAALDRRPPLTGGPAQYPPGLDQVLPRGGALALGYPPHLEVLRNGYRLGLTWMAAHPGEALGLMARKLVHGWQGAATGFGSTGIPLRTSGTRRSVDLVTADGPWPVVWRALLLLTAGWGFLRCRRNPGTAVWTVFVVGKVAVLAAFFGYARLGALCIPALALWWAASWTALPWTSGWRRVLQALGGWLLVVELLRIVLTPQVLVDGAPLPSAPPAPAAAEHRTVQVVSPRFAGF